jgi:hypothetical protein
MHFPLSRSRERRGPIDALCIDWEVRETRYFSNTLLACFTMASGTARPAA